MNSDSLIDLTTDTQEAELSAYQINYRCKYEMVSRCILIYFGDTG